MRKTAILITVVLVLFSVQLYAQTSGVLKGQVRDNNGEPVPQANVVLQVDGNNTQFGTSTDEYGEYIIINISPGSYDLLISAVGYRQQLIQGVDINVNQTTNRDPVRLEPGDNTLEAVTFTEKKQKIVKDRVGTERSITVSDIGDLSVSSVDDIMALQPGVTNVGGEIRVRGSRSNEVNFTVDGMSVSDPVDGGSALQIDTDAIADMKIYTGALTAEFGNAQSGMVNIVTHSGYPVYKGKVEWNTDHLVDDGRNQDLVRFNIGGPVLGNYGSARNLNSRFTFFVNGTGAWTDGRYAKYYESDPYADFTFNGSPLVDEYPIYDVYGNREEIAGFALNSRNYNDYNLNFKTKYQINNDANVTFAVRGDRSTYNLFNWRWKYALQHFAESETEQRQYVFTYDQNLSQTANLKLKASYFQKDTYEGPKAIDRDRFLIQRVTNQELNANPDVMNDYILNVLNTEGIFLYDHPAYVSIDSDGDGVYDYYSSFRPTTEWTYETNALDDPGIPGFNAPGSIYTNFVDDTTTSLNFRGDVEWAINRNNSAKTGFELTKYTIEKNQLQSFTTIYNDRRAAFLKTIFDTNSLEAELSPEEIENIITGNPDVVTIFGDGTPDNPYFAVYSPESYFNASKASSGTRDGYRAEPIQAAFYLQNKMEWEGMIVNAGLRFDYWYIGEDYEVLQDDGTYRVFEFEGKDKSQLMISPRVGVSHPISERDVLRFAYNYQNQLPAMRNIFTSKTPQDAYTSDNLITVGNAELEPQITITYEVGLQHLINEDWSVDLSLYYKNYYNYVNTRKVIDPDEPQVFWYEFISEDYASGRGIEVSLQKGLSNFWSSNISYSFAWAEGNNSSAVIQDENTNLREFPLDWDIRNNLSLSLMFRIERGEEFFIPFTEYILPLDDFSTSFTYSYSSGEPYTPVDPITSKPLDPNSERKDARQNASLKLSKKFNVSQNTFINVFFDIDNLFKYRNINNVYAKTGDPFDSGEDFTVNDISIPEVNFMRQQQYNDPGRVSQDRSYSFGVSYNF